MVPRAESVLAIRYSPEDHCAPQKHFNLKSYRFSPNLFVRRISAERARWLCRPEHEGLNPTYQPNWSRRAAPKPGNSAPWCTKSYQLGSPASHWRGSAREAGQTANSRESKLRLDLWAVSLPRAMHPFGDSVTMWGAVQHTCPGAPIPPFMGPMQKPGRGFPPTLPHEFFPYFSKASPHACVGRQGEAFSARHLKRWVNSRPHRGPSRGLTEIGPPPLLSRKTRLQRQNPSGSPPAPPTTP